MPDEAAAAMSAAFRPADRADAPVPWTWLGRIHHDRSTALQERIREDVLAGRATGALLLCEHEPVVTLGRRARPEHLLLSPEEFARRGIDLRPVSRGGEVTYHGPGQLVAYPVVRLRRGVVAHVEGMARAIIDLLRPYGVEGTWRRDQPGVWVDGAKICAFGVHVRRGVAIHGLALNVVLPTGAFAPIVPCGQATAAVTSLHDHLSVPPRLGESKPLSPAALTADLVRGLSEHLQLRFEERSADALGQFPDCKTDRHR